ncbi:CdaR family transcriptional regulator [Actinoplanes sp. L3-i22]|uniref:PucR family transcriptional regulator n=1 Tax=Actinoplanes sp. L3-i22 TaxID=2836373 RepID=UPI001C773152|nr:helix-turn-helix domain-containing protein [Actinoplanes sp. L3-i22]BCY09318.1 putative transcriptional regulator [Actinoplanes sp. L3-i22]
MPTGAELRGYRQYGRMRAESGVPLETTMAVHHIGLRTAWERLVVLARDRGLDRSAALPGVVNIMMAWTEALSAAAADGYADAGQQRDLAGLDHGQQFTERLQTGQIADPGLRLLARSLNFDPDGGFQAVYYTAGLAQGGAPNLNRWIRAGAEAAGLAVFGATTLVVFQAITADRILDLLAVPDTAPAGVGLIRTGLAGAVDSVVDAERALRLAARRQTVVRFEQDWLAASILPELDRLRPLLDAATAADQEHLEAAIRAYAKSSFSISEAARALHIHPNSLKYRLDRWQALTGWDPRTLDGLQRSLLAVEMRGA